MRRALLAVSAMMLATAARGQLKVVDTVDVVHLVSGEEVRGTVLAEGLKAVIIIVDDRERTIPREQVRSISRGEASPNVKCYATETVEGVKVVTGVGTDEPAEETPEERGKRPRRKPSKGGGGKVVPKIDKAQARKLLGKDKNLRDLADRFGGTENALKLLEQYKGNPQLQKLIDEYRKTGKLPGGFPLGGGRKKKR